jgi:hypothetical protein
MSVYVYEPPRDIGLDELEDALTRAFNSIREAVASGDAVVINLDERNVQAAGEPAQAALAYGLIGLTRALAIEGTRPGWRIAALSSPSSTDDGERIRWIKHLGSSAQSNGVLVRLGGEHLGRVAV